MSLDSHRWTSLTPVHTLLVLCSTASSMKLVTFEDSVRRSRVGALVADGRIVDLNSACALYLRELEHESAFDRLADALVPSNMRELFGGGDTSMEAARKALDYVLEEDGATGPRGESIFYSSDEVALKAPIVPRKFFHPAGFLNVDAIIGHDEPVIYPDHLTQELDCEIQLAVVVKKGGRSFTSKDAGEYTAGYVIFNQITARDIQRRESKSGASLLCHGIKTFCPLGPWIVTADEISDPHQLAMELRLNDGIRSSSHSSKMALKVSDLLSKYSPMGFSAGDVISTGTVSDAITSNGDSKARHLKVGDFVECEIEKIGILRNQVISWEEAYGRKTGISVVPETSS
jgi:2-keto-4-pentenoate hydratase/2-oxohepta-3-ene-1,7-dioic acid hydratase in catechol pathway